MIEAQLTHRYFSLKCAPCFFRKAKYSSTKGMCPMMFELLLRVMERAWEIPRLNTPSPVANLFCLAIPHSRFPPSNLRIGAHICTNHTVPYGTALLGWRRPRHFVPGYDHAVPPGRSRFRVEAVRAGMAVGRSNGRPPDGSRVSCWI